MTSASSLLDRLRALPLDRAPLRRAGVLAGLLVLLLVAGRWLGPSASGPSVAEARRQNVQPAAEEASAPPASPWTAGRFAGLLLLVAGGGVAFWLHRRGAPSGPAPAASIETLGTHALAGGHALRLVGCGGDVLLLSVGPDGARLLRQWPRDSFDGEADEDTPDVPAACFAEALAAASAPPVEEPPVEAPLQTDEGLPTLTASGLEAQAGRGGEPAKPAVDLVPKGGDLSSPSQAASASSSPAEAAPLAEAAPIASPDEAPPRPDPADVADLPQGGGDGADYAPQGRPAALPQFLAFRG